MKQFVRSSVIALVLFLGSSAATAQTCTPAQVIQCNQTFANTLIIANEWNRASGGTSSFVNDSFTEFILIQPLSVSTMNEMAFGDSDTNRATKNSIVHFQNMGGLLTGTGLTFFPVGTVIVVAGSNSSPTQDLSYDPVNGDWNIVISTSNSTYMNIVSNTGVIENKDTVWVDRRTNPNYSNTNVSEEGFGLVFGSPAANSGIGISATVVGVGTPGNGKCISLISTLDCACVSSSWDNQVQEPCSPGTCNGGFNSAYCSGLQQDPLLANVIAMSATGKPGGRITVSWETDFEEDNAGFHVYRVLYGEEKSLNNGDDLGQRLTPYLIPAEGSEFSGAVYEFVTDDVLIREGQYGYWLEDVDIHGVRTLHGPILSTFSAQSLDTTAVENWSGYN